MKRTLFILVMAVYAVGFQSCSSDDGSSNENPVSGTWRLVEVQVSQQQLTQFAPADEDIVITFNLGSDFNGSTSVNQFSGRYELNGTTLTMLEFTTTEVADTLFAAAFYSAIAEAQVANAEFAQFGYSFESQNLVLVFGNSGQMVFEGQ